MVMIIASFSIHGGSDWRDFFNSEGNKNHENIIPYIIALFVIVIKLQERNNESWYK